MRRSIVIAAIVASAMAQSCSRHTSESTQSTATLRRNATLDICIDDSLRFHRDYILHIDSPALRIVRADSTCATSVTLTGRRAVIASRTEATAISRSELAHVDSITAETAQSHVKSHESSRSRWWLPLLAAVAAGLTLLLSLRGIGLRR